MLKALGRQIRHHEMVLITGLIALSILLFPLQKHIPLSRFEHYGMSIYVWALGFIAQVAVSWRILSPLGRASYISAAIYLGTFGATIYNNPWLDRHISLQTYAQEEMIDGFFLVAIGSGILVSLLWFVWFIQEAAKQADLDSKNNETTHE